ncbi:MAG TPA: hypothetical protein VF371_11665 [Candidatus Limnocylindrales bacterium]
MFTFSHHPTAITVSDGIQDAFLYLQKSWRTWLPVVVVIAACAVVTHALIGSLDISTLYHQDVYTGQVVWLPDAPNKLYGAFAARVVDGLLSMIGGWVFYATAIAGLRNRTVTLSDVIIRGLVSLLSGLVVAVVAIFVVTSLLMLGIAIAIVVPPVGGLLIILLMLAAIPSAIYLLIRLIFISLAIFDGFGPIAGIRESLRLSQGSVSRMLGWGALAFLVTIGISILASVVVAPFSGSGPAAVAEGASTAITMTGSGLIVFMLAVLYESERARKDPMLYPVPAWPGYGSYPAEPYVPGPYPARPYAPGPYTAGPYAGGPYPTDPTAIPGWIDPNGPAPAWPAAPYGPGPYPANQGAMPGWVAPGWVAPGPAPAWPAAPYAQGPYPANPAATPGWVGPSGPAPAWATNPVQPAALDPAGPGPDPAPMGNSNETDPTQQPPNTTHPPEAPTS